MKQFLKRFFYYPWRFCYRLVCWINYPTRANACGICTRWAKRKGAKKP